MQEVYYKKGLLHRVVLPGIGKIVEEKELTRFKNEKG